ncbi:diguanylate cyclase [Solwaraspora sp. WMMD1047]|uniref:GGDEF domain-containing protein n=1 Tax=Solwaraspora sp. WMMD1047 TaxID=3016102 RepID=UPI00241713DE|nr:diguanylate cyclase [Solwaraspora sp. WMMD1047]MDG4833491.1 diguanylate cyclase [Solwaraspora sp. WMMD1047]
MTLRGRLTSAFLAVVLGPVLLGAGFVGVTAATVGHQRSEDRLSLAATTVRNTITALCQQLYSAAAAVAVATDRSGLATEFVTQGLASAVLVTAANGTPVLITPDPPAGPWADCGGDRSTAVAPRAIAARVELRDTAGTPSGSVHAAQVLDTAFVTRLAAATGTAVTLLPAKPAATGPAGPASPTGGPEATAGPVTDGSAAEGPAAEGPATDGSAADGSVAEGSAPGGSATRESIDGGPPAVDPDADGGPSTEPSGTRESVFAAAERITGDGIVETRGGRYVKRIGPAPGQPLPLILSVAREPSRTLHALLAGAVGVAGVLALLAARRLARSTTRPLVELARAAARMAGGDLTARLPVRAPDEVGRLASTFNRITRETQTYAQALTVSRDQLRGHLAILGDTLASTHDLPRILRVILRTAVTATGARAGLVLLFDPATGTLVCRCAEGLSPTAGADDGPIRFGAGLLGAVAATGEPRRGRVDRDGPALAEHEPRCHTYVAVPFTAAGQPHQPGLPLPATVAGRPDAIGVLALYDRHGGDEFDDADLATLRTFARHASVAVENVRIHEEAQRLSLTDPLTGLWNYRYLTESVRREVERASRFGRMLSVLALDLDRFKGVNDSYGHAAGDAVLAEFARRIRNLVREVDLAFRRGGEEFVVLLPETDAPGAATVAERLGATIRDTPITVDAEVGPAGERRRISVTVSIGIAVYPDHAFTGPHLLEAADQALYAAKSAGRDTYRIAVPRIGPPVAELAVAGGAVPPADDLPRAGRAPRPADATDGEVGRPGGASSGAHPPLQTRGR